MLDRLEHDLDGHVNKLCGNVLKKLLMWKGVLVAKVRMAEKLGKKS